jgi:hypothetical protein
MIEYVKRLAGPFTAEGATNLPFGFKIFDPTDVFVAASTDPNTSSTALVYGKDYSVKMNEDQDTVPGGTVVLSSPISTGQVVVIGSAVAYTQNTQLTNFSRFPPEIINESLDRIVVQIQQLVELTGRTISLPPTSSLTVSEFLDNLLNAAKDAANSADEAAQYARICEEIKQNIFIYSWDIPHVVDTLDDVENYPYDGFFAVGGYGDPGHHGQDISNRVVKALGSTKLRTLGERFSDVVNVRDFGAKGDYDADDTTAIVAADAFCAKNGKTLFFPRGQYGITKSIVQTCDWVGEVAPVLAPFPQGDDHKKFLSPGKKNLLPGTSVILKSSSALSTFTTTRNDIFSSFTYAVKTKTGAPVKLHRIAIVADVDVYDAEGRLTEVGADNRVECDVGYLIDNCPRCISEDRVVFGYWSKAGTCYVSSGVGDNPDYSTTFGGSTMGYYGLAILGSTEPTLWGLSGTTFFGTQIFANDHHTRRPQRLKTGQDHSYGHCLFIDGDVDAQAVELNGTYFIGCHLRTYSNRPLRFDHASNVVFTAGALEFASKAYAEETKGHKFVATQNTKLITFSGIRSLSPSLFAHSEFGDVVEKLIVTGGHQYGDLLVGSKGGYARLASTSRANAISPVLEFTKEPSLSSAGSGIEADSTTCAMKFRRYGTYTGSTLSIDSTGAITPTESRHLVTNANGTTTEVSKIDGSFYAGQRLLLTNYYQDSSIILKHNAPGGNIRFVDSRDRVLRGPHQSIVLMFNGSAWVEENAMSIDRTFSPTHEDGVHALGTANLRWSQVYAATASINTSDEREKTSIVDPEDALMRAWGKVNFKVFQFKDAVEKKGIDARLHVGVIAQEVKAAFESEGLDANRFGLLCYDEWEDEYETVEVVDTPEVLNEHGEIITPAITHVEKRLITKAGNRYGIRYEEALALECAYLRWEIQKIKNNQEDK